MTPKKNLLYLASLVFLLAMPLLGLGSAVGAAQQIPASAIIKPASQIEIPPPQVRTWKEMEADAALEAASSALKGPQAREIKKFMPVMGAAAYEALKAQAAQAGALQAPLAPGVASPEPLAATTLTNPVNFEGVDAVTAGNFRPPDTHGAAGLNHFVEITNSHLDIYLKAAPNTRVQGVSLASFFGYATRTLFDPRVVYDPGFNRWIMTADARAESVTVQYFFIAVSQTTDPLGSYYIYRVNVSNGFGADNGVQWDYPQVGFDQNAVIFTANFFNSAGGFIDARMFTVAKSLLYNGPGQTLSPTLFTGLAGTLTPPIVLDTNPNTYLVVADAPDNKVTLYTLTNSAADPPTLSAAVTIPVPAFAIPPSATQPGTAATLDTLEGRFVNASTQTGNSLFQVHTINIGGYARPRFYEFDTVNKVVLQSGTFAGSGTSHDFNASIAANRFKDVFVTWSSTDPTNSVNAEVRFSGRLHTDTAGLIPSPGSLLYGSNTFYNVTGSGTQRWGDYSAVSLDPADTTGLTAWIVNERILTNTTWGSRIGSIKLPGRRSLVGPYLLLLLN
ncbi:MAG: hypothetical protein PHX53_16995 [Syntrophales bacterium]|nr:hypothetical protein [Syntrophales bacterium]